MKGHLAALDGWLARTDMPVDVHNTIDYWSGHYKIYGLNIQALVGPNLEFLYFCVAAPGKTNDSPAFKRCQGLIDWLNDLPPEYFISADNAYILSRKVLIPHDKVHLTGEAQRVYNYYLSQLRIRVEMAFGLLTTKFRLLRHGLNFYNKKNSLVIQACSRLHNFCIRTKPQVEDEAPLDDDTVRINPQNFGIHPLEHSTDGETTTYNMGFLETVREIEQEEAACAEQGEVNVSDDSRRKEMVASIRSSDLCHPMKNISRNGSNCKC